jgi:1-aminocyclopropane-1-carboxylate deaminase/D-cysteine desulfhydrase-like pyridoxal-dependent ACC family enzyme
MLTRSTPVELHNGIWVKREDLCAVPPAPPFSKYRGVEAHIKKRPEQVIGVLDTLHSKAGWAVAAACQALGKRCINFYPVFAREEPGTIRPYQQEAAALGAELVGMQAGMSAVLWNQARNRLHQRYPPESLMPQSETGYMMPNALKIEESADETAKELSTSTSTILMNPDRVVISVSSGTIAAGVLRGLAQARLRPTIDLHLGYSRPEAAVRKYLRRMAGVYSQGLLNIIDEGYAYSDAVTDIKAPFPCNAYYDLKAWKWLLKQEREEGEIILFWNIGA